MKGNEVPCEFFQNQQLLTFLYCMEGIYFLYHLCDIGSLFIFIILFIICFCKFFVEIEWAWTKEIEGKFVGVSFIHMGNDNFQMWIPLATVQLQRILCDHVM